MAIVATTALRNAWMDAITTAIDAGAGAGVLEIGTTGMASVLATITFSDPCAAGASGGVWTMSGAPKSVAASATGTASEARIRDSASNNVLTGLTVGTSGSNINLDSVSITSGQTVNITSLTLTAPHA